ncbi:hypothetical protein GCM10025771_04680 [Niveibacterium umoris]|uniref:DUF4124 domain-containing protein n=1 Tax=Niveibacterium umoris TaxID=1193620 RepID=A0A840BT48_9RHOO|nr:hypothetical protein [Niveibacterium umoris]MBB4013986.1 hypothetical protein [Niveibacterium umoris]
MRVFIALFLLTAAAVTGLFALMHGDPRPQLKAAVERATPPIPALPDPAGVVQVEPAQPPGAGIHKCVKRGQVVYTDQPCPKDHDQRALDPERSRIVTLPATKPAAPAGQNVAKPASGGLDIAEDGSVRRAP